MNDNFERLKFKHYEKDKEQHLIAKISLMSMMMIRIKIQVSSINNILKT